MTALSSVTHNPILPEIDLTDTDTLKRYNSWIQGGMTDEEAKTLLRKEALRKNTSETATQAIQSTAGQDATATDGITATVINPKEEATAKKLAKRKCVKGCNNSCNKEKAMLILSYFPVLGIVPSIMSKVTEAKKKKQTSEIEQITSIIKKQNQFRIASITQAILSVAIIASAVAFAVFAGWFALAVGAGLIAAAAAITVGFVTYDAVQLCRNNQKKPPVVEIKPIAQIEVKKTEETTKVVETVKTV